MEEKATYQTDELISNIGGYLGLVLGLRIVIFQKLINQKYRRHVDVSVLVVSTNQWITSKSILKILHGCVWIFSRFQYLGVFLCRWVSSTCEKYFELRIVAYDCPRLSSPTLNTLFQVRNCNLNAFKRKKHFASRMCKTPGANTIKVLFRKTITSNLRILIKTEDFEPIHSPILKTIGTSKVCGRTKSRIPDISVSV